MAGIACRPVGLITSRNTPTESGPTSSMIREYSPTVKSEWFSSSSRIPVPASSAAASRRVSVT